MSRPKVIKTNILKHNKNLQKLIGLGGYEQEDVPMAKRQLTFMSILMSSSMITCSINLYNYMGQVKIATELMFCAALYTVVLSSFFTVIRNRDTVRGFFHEIQRFVDESKFVIPSKFVKICNLNSFKEMHIEMMIFIQKPNK